MDRLPPLRLLVTFEEISRAGSMREAASRLNVTPPAVTQALKALEAHIGVALFDRSVKPAVLTTAGEALARATRSGFSQIDVAIEDIRAAAGLSARRVVVSCTAGMATYWLMPRLSEFYAEHPDVVVNVQAPPSGRPALASGVDIALHYGDGRWREGTTIKLFDERVGPVGRPDLVEALLRAGRDICAAPLIHVRSEAAHRWEGWPEYLARKGLGRPHGPAQSFDNYIQAVQAALDGRGLMLGWRSITDKLVRDGTLAAWPGGHCDLGTAYFLTVAPSCEKKPAVSAFQEWITRVAKASSVNTQRESRSQLD